MGRVVVRYAYDAWGNHAVLDSNGNNITSATHIGTLNPFRYRGYYYDTETGLYYLQTRYYDPELCRFMTIDSIENIEPEHINGLNLYAYCNNNPIMMVDPDGTVPKWLGWVLAAVVLVGLAIATVFTFGAAAPITGFAASMVVGAMIGATVGFGVSVISQGITNGWYKINPWQVFLDTAIGAISGAISGAASSTTSVGLRVGLKGARVLLSGAGAGISSWIEGKSVNEIMVNVGMAMAFSAVIQGIFSIPDKIMGKFSHSVLELRHLDGILRLGVLESFLTGGAVFAKTSWKYFQAPALKLVQLVYKLIWG